MSVLKQFKISLNKYMKIVNGSVGKLHIKMIFGLKGEKSAKLDAQPQIFAILSRKIQIKPNIYQ